MNKLGAYLAAARKKTELSLRGVEAETGISNAYISQLETGKIKTPSPTVLHTLAQRYDVSYDTLMELAGYPVSDRSSLKGDQEKSKLAARLGDISEDEEDALIGFLEIIRKRERGRR